jgi:hypothetical protein
MTTLEGTFQQPQSIPDIIREGFANWQSKRQENTNTRSREQALIRMSYRNEVDRVQTAITPTTTALERSVLEAALHTTHIDDAREGLTTIVSDFLLETTITEAFTARLQATHSKPTEGNSTMTHEPTGPQPTTIFGGIQTSEAVIEQKMHEQCRVLFGRLGIGGDSTKKDGQTAFKQLRDAAQSLVGEKNEALVTAAMETGLKEQGTKHLSAYVATAVQSDLIAATAIHAAGLQENDLLPPGIETTLTKLTNLILTDYQTEKLQMDHATQIKQLWTRLESQMRQVLFEQRSDRIQLPGKSEALRKAAAQAVFSSHSREHQRAIVDAMEDEKGLDTFSKISKKAVSIGRFFVLTNMLLAACNGPKPPGGSATPIPVDTRDHDGTPSPTPEATATVITGPGPFTGTETPPAPIGPYPDAFSLQSMQSLLAQSLNPDALLASPYANDTRETVRINETWCNLSATCPHNADVEVIYNPIAQRWSTVAVDGSGNPAAWGSFVNDDGTKNYWEQPFWDSSLFGHTTQNINDQIAAGKIRFDLPPLQSPDHHWDVGITNEGGYTVLVEVDENGQPFGWFNAATDTLDAVIGAPTEIPSPEFSMGLPAKIEQCNQVAWDEKTMPAFMQDHTQAVLDYADQQGWTADTVSPINLWNNGNFTTNKNILPHSFLDAEISNPNIADCTEITMPDGTSLVVLSVVTKIHRVDNATRTVLNFVLDQEGMKNFANANGWTPLTAQDILDGIHAIQAEGKDMVFKTQIWVPGPNSNATIETTQWPNTGVVDIFNQNHSGTLDPTQIPTEDQVPQLTFPGILSGFLHLSSGTPNPEELKLENELAAELIEKLIPVRTITIEAGQ